MKKTRNTEHGTRKRGYTLLEILLGIAIIAVLLAAVAASFSEYRDRQVMNSQAMAVASLLNRARTQTLSSYEGSEYGVHFESGRAVLFQGFTFTDGAAYNREVSMHPSVTLSWDLNGGGADVFFERLTGEATSTYGTTTITLNSDGAITREVVIKRSGIVNQ